MIDQLSLNKEWIEKISSDKKADKILVEKVIHALALLEGLAKTDLDFCFKGGTAVMLMLNSDRRLSIDIDIIVSDKCADLNPYISLICKEYGFANFVKQERHASTKIEKQHFKLHFISVVTGKDSNILLDVLNENLYYNNIVLTPITSSFLIEKGPKMAVRTPDFNNILADKLTAFAPNTTGIPYLKKGQEMGMEINKQLYDVGCLFDEADDIASIAKVFTMFAQKELSYRGYQSTVEDALNDIINTALSFCLRKNYMDNCNWDILNKGLTQVKSFIFSETYHIEKAITHAAKVAYMATLIQNGETEMKHFSETINMKDWIINQPFDTKLNKIKRSNPEAFFYLYQMYLIKK